MDIVANIPKENDQTNQILVEQFKHFNIEIYGTFEEPLFKAKDIGNLLEIKDIRTTLKNFDKDEGHTMPVTDSLGRLQETNMLTEQGLYRMLMISRKPIAKEFQKWVFNIIKQIRLNSNKQLENKIKELEFHKIPSYEELPLDETVYCHSTDIENVFKIGKSANSNSKKRKSGSQTPCVKDIKILYEVKTSDCDVLEKLVHHALDYHRVGKREHFRCSLDHIKFVFDKCNKFVNTIGGIRQTITEKEFTEKLGTSINKDNIIDKVVEKIVKKVVYKTKYNTEDLSDIDLDELLSIDEPKILIQELN
jgi:prophage antirepressor-like protein